MGTFLDRIDTFAASVLVPLARNIVVQMYKDKGIEVSEEEVRQYFQRQGKFFLKTDTTIVAVVHFEVPSKQDVLGFAMHIVFEYDDAKVTLENNDWVNSPTKITFAYPIVGKFVDCPVQIDKSGNIYISWEAIVV